MPAAVEGHCDPRFEPLRDAFRANFAERGELGAAVCVMINGHVVADLYGGWADQERGRRWQPDTLVNMFSVGKGLVAACTARLAGQGKLDLDATVAAYWPEFAAANKDAITVRQVLSHQAGLPAVRRRLPPGAMLDWSAMTTALAEQEPWWELGTAHGYHVNTFGFLAGEVIRRITGITVGKLLRDEIAGPLGADVHIGLPASQHERVAAFVWPGPPPAEEEPPGLEPAQLMEHNSYYNPGGLSGAGVINTPRWRAAESPSTNAHGTACGVARVYAALIGRTAIVDPAALKEAAAEQVYGQDLVLHRPSRFGLGFQLTQPERPIGPGRATFGHFGAGGSLGFADPETGIAFGYVMNQMGPRWQRPPHPSPGGHRICVPVTRIKVAPGASVLQKGDFMMDAADFGGQNWLIMPAARAVNEAAPANISRQRWLLVISGVTIVNMQGRSSDDWLRDDIHILPDMRGPLDLAINRYGIPRPQGTEGLNYEVGFQLRQWSPFAGLSSAFDQDQSVNARFAVDGWRPSPFTFGTDAFSWRQVNGLFTGIIVSAAARDSDARPYRVGYKITLTGRIIFTQIIIQQAGVRGNVPGTLTA